jgi:plasmid stability protein
VKHIDLNDLPPEAARLLRLRARMSGREVEEEALVALVGALTFASSKDPMRDMIAAGRDVGLSDAEVERLFGFATDSPA